MAPRMTVARSLVLWGPAVTIAAGFALLDEPTWAAVVLGGVWLFHAISDPRFAMFTLVIAIPLNWTVGIIPGAATASKLIGVLTLLVSIPKLLQAARRPLKKWDPALKWIVLLVTWALAGVLWATRPVDALIGAQSLLLVWGIALLVPIHFADRDNWKTALVVFMIASAVSAAIFVGTGNIDAVISGGDRNVARTLVGAAQTGRGTVNTVARIYGVALIAAIFLWMDTRSLKLRGLVLIASVVLVLAITFTKARAVYIGLPTAIVGGFLLFRGQVGTRIKALFSLAFLGGASLTLTAMAGFFGKSIGQRFNSTFAEGFMSGNRAILWRAHFDAFVDSWGLGTGINQMAKTSASLFHVAHNDIFAILGELGLIGIIAFVGFHVGLFRRIRAQKSPTINNFALTVWIFMLWVGLTQNDYYLKWYALSAGLVIAGIRLRPKNNPKPISAQKTYSIPAKMSQ